MINLHNIKKIYGDRTVLDIENLTFSKGETVAIVGPNGSGKSTLLKIIADTIKSDVGEIERKGKILYLPQQNISFRKSLRKNILYSMKKTENKDKRCDEILGQLGPTRRSLQRGPRPPCGAWGVSGWSACIGR